MQHKEEIEAIQFQFYDFTFSENRKKKKFKNQTSKGHFNFFFSTGYLGNIMAFLLETHVWPMNYLIHTYYSD